MSLRKRNKTAITFLEYLNYNNIVISKDIRKKILSSVNLRNDLLSNDTEIGLPLESREKISSLFDNFILSQQNARPRPIGDRMALYEEVFYKLSTDDTISSDMMEKLLKVKSVDDIKKYNLSEDLEEKIIQQYKLYCDKLQEKEKSFRDWKNDNPDIHQKLFSDVISEKDLLKHLFHNYIGVSHFLNKYSSNSNFNQFKDILLKSFKELNINSTFISSEQVGEILSQCTFNFLNQRNTNLIQKARNKEISDQLTLFISNKEIQIDESVIFAEIINYIINFRHNFQFRDKTIDTAKNIKLPHDLEYKDIIFPYPISHFQLSSAQAKRLGIAKNIIIDVKNVQKDETAIRNWQNLEEIAEQNEELRNTVEYYKKLVEKEKSANETRIIRLTTFEPSIRRNYNPREVTQAIINNNQEYLNNIPDNHVSACFEPMVLNFIITDTMTFQETLDYSYLNHFLQAHVNRLNNPEYALKDFQNKFIHDSINNINENLAKIHNTFYCVISLFTLINNAKRKPNKNRKPSIFFEQTQKKAKTYEDIVIGLRQRKITQKISDQSLKLTQNTNDEDDANGTLESENLVPVTKGKRKHPHFRRSHYRFIRSEEGLSPILVSATYVNEDLLTDDDEFLSPTYKV